MTVTPDGIGPATAPRLPSLRGRPDGLMVIDEVGEVILNEILARHAEVHRIPEVELITEFSVTRSSHYSTMLQTTVII